MTRRTQDHTVGYILFVLVWIFFFGGAALQELGCGG